jgi:two-component system, chemotaxis family, protein-glutamate methylesterase/glutaminase
LFLSAAEHFDSRAIPVVLSGVLFDGTKGVCAIAQKGGKVLAQDEASCLQSGMPQAVRTGSVDFILPVATIAHALVLLVMVPGAAQWFNVKKKVFTTDN